MSIRMGKCSELGAELVVRYIGEPRSFVMAISRTSGVAEGL